MISFWEEISMMQWFGIVLGLVLAWVMVVAFRRQALSLSRLYQEQHQAVQLLQGIAHNLGVKVSNSNRVASMPPGIYKLYIGNLGEQVTEQDLGDLFSRFGQIKQVIIPLNRYTKKARNFGFVSFMHLEDAKRALKLDGTDLKGNVIQVNFAKERE